MSLLSHHFTKQRKIGTIASSSSQQQSIKNQFAATTNIKVSSSPPPSQSIVVISSSPPSKSSSASTYTLPASLLPLVRSIRSSTIGWEIESDAEIILRKFDMDMKFGPSTGVSRMDRWQRAQKMRLEPPEYIMEILNGQHFQSQNQNSSTSSSSSALIEEPKPESGMKNGCASHSYIHLTV